MRTPGPATIFLTTVLGFPRNEQLAAGVFVVTTSGCFSLVGTEVRSAAA